MQRALQFHKTRKNNFSIFDYILNILLRSAHIKKYTDSELLAKYKESAQISFVGELFDRYTHLVFGVCMKYLRNEEDSKDAVMQIFEKLFSELKKHEIAQFKGWLYSVTKNYCLMQLRSKQTQLDQKEELRNEISFMESSYEMNLNKEEELEISVSKLKEAIEQLSTEQKRCVELFYLQEYCYQEVAQITGYTMKQVKSYIQNGKRNLKNYLTGNNE